MAWRGWIQARNILPVKAWQHWVAQIAFTLLAAASCLGSSLPSLCCFSSPSALANFAIQLSLGDFAALSKNLLAFSLHVGIWSHQHFLPDFTAVATLPGLAALLSKI